MQGIETFPTVFGRNLVGELRNFVPRPYLVVTMADLEPVFRVALGPDAQVYHVRSMEQETLEADLRQTEGLAAVVGLGGGQALDAAKYFAWRQRLPLFQVPTSLSVDAVFGHRAGVRENSHLGVEFIRESFAAPVRRVLRLVTDVAMAGFGLAVRCSSSE